MIFSARWVLIQHRVNLWNGNFGFLDHSVLEYSAIRNLQVQSTHACTHWTASFIVIEIHANHHHREARISAECPVPRLRHVPRSQIDPGSGIPGSGILDYLGSYIFPWDLRDLGSFHGNIFAGSQGSWIFDRKDSAGSWRSWIPLEQVVLGSCRSWILQNNNVTAFWTSLTSNETSVLVPHILALLKLGHCWEFQPRIDSTIPCWL